MESNSECYLVANNNYKGYKTIVPKIYYYLLSNASSMTKQETNAPHQSLKTATQLTSHKPLNQSHALSWFLGLIGDENFELDRQSGIFYDRRSG